MPWPVCQGYPGGFPLRSAQTGTLYVTVFQKQYEGTVLVGIKLSLINKFFPGPQLVRHQDVIKSSHILKLLKS